MDDCLIVASSMKLLAQSRNLEPSCTLLRRKHSSVKTSSSIICIFNCICICFYLAPEGSFKDTEQLMLIELCPGPSSQPRDPYAWNYRELRTPLTLGESSVMPGTRTKDPWV